MLEVNAAVQFHDPKDKLPTTNIAVAGYYLVDGQVGSYEPVMVYLDEDDGRWYEVRLMRTHGDPEPVDPPDLWCMPPMPSENTWGEFDIVDFDITVRSPDSECRVGNGSIAVYLKFSSERVIVSHHPESSASVSGITSLSPAEVVFESAEVPGGQKDAVIKMLEITEGG